MNKLLYIQASPRGKRSHCIAVADAFIEAYKRKHLDDKIVILNVFDTSIPNFDGAGGTGQVHNFARQLPTQKKNFKPGKEVEKVIEQFISANKYVLAVPMWNFSIPYRLKQYIDLMVQPGYTFSYSEDTGYQGLVVGKPMLVVYARGGEYPAESEAEAFDLQTKYIELIFGFMGFEDIYSVVVEPTLQGGPDVAIAKRKAVIEQVRKLAIDF